MTIGSIAAICTVAVVTIIALLVSISNDEGIGE